MKLPKNKSFVLVVLFIAIGITVGTGAFTTVTAQRTATVNVAGDSSALLKLTPHSGPNGQEYASLDNNQLTITLNEVNLDATTTVNKVFNITNHGSQTVEVYLVDDGPNNDRVTFYEGLTTSGSIVEEESNSVTVSSGDTVTISIKIDTVGITNDNAELINSVTVYANATG